MDDYAITKKTNEAGTIDARIMLLARDYYAKTLIELSESAPVVRMTTNIEAVNNDKLLKSVYTTLSTMVASDFFIGNITNDMALSVMVTLRRRLENDHILFRDAEKKFSKYANTELTVGTTEIVVDNDFNLNDLEVDPGTVAIVKP